MKDLGEATYILGIKIYRDISRRLIGLSQRTYLDKILKKFKMDRSEKGFLLVLQGVKLSETQCPTTAEDREKMKVIPYASAVGSIMYVMWILFHASTPFQKQIRGNRFFLPIPTCIT